MFESRFAVVQAMLHAALALSALYTDLKYNKIYNKVVYPALGLGLLMALLEALFGAPPEGLWWLPLAKHFGGAAFAFVLFWALFIKGGVGGGDVKLVAAGGALIGFPFIIYVLMYSSIVGLAMGLATVIWRRKTLAFLKSCFNVKGLFRKRALEESVQLVPFGVAYALGTAWAHLMTL